MYSPPMERKATILCVKSKNSKEHESKFRAPKRRVIREESAETQEHVRPQEELSQEADAMGFVPSALREPRGALHWCDSRCSEKALRYMQVASMVTEEGTINVCNRCYCNSRKGGLE